MRITKYTTLISDNRYPELLKEKSVNYKNADFTTPEDVASMMNEIFKLDRQTEEFLFVLCFDTKMKLNGIFEVSHGTFNHTIVSTRDIFMKALLCGACNIILVHNHPSGDETPSMADHKVKVTLEKAGMLLGIPVVDNIIIGADGRYFSFYPRHEK